MQRRAHRHFFGEGGGGKVRGVTGATRTIRVWFDGRPSTKPRHQATLLTEVASSMQSALRSGSHSVGKVMRTSGF